MAQPGDSISEALPGSCPVRLSSQLLCCWMVCPVKKAIPGTYVARYISAIGLSRFAAVRAALRGDRHSGLLIEVT